MMCKSKHIGETNGLPGLAPHTATVVTPDVYFVVTHCCSLLHTKHFCHIIIQLIIRYILSVGILVVGALYIVGFTY